MVGARRHRVNGLPRRGGHRRGMASDDGRARRRSDVRDWPPRQRSATIRAPHCSDTFEMIAKPYKNKTLHLDPRQRAGAAAENQMAHYLHRAFKQDREVHVLHALCLRDAEQPEQDGSPGVCQIDHLLVHRWGLFIIESKSVTDEVRMRSDGSGGDEWSRVYRGKETGMASPIRQARRQSFTVCTVEQRDHCSRSRMP